MGEHPNGSAATHTATEQEMKIAVTNPILADLVSQVVGPNAQVVTLIPPGRDPHTFEPSLRTVRDIATADISFANGLLLEPPALAETLQNSSAAPVIEVAERAATHGAQLIPLVENISLDAIWLGFRVDGKDNTDFELKQVTGPGSVSAYVVSTFGTPQVLFTNQGTTSLPAHAHTHISWAFSEPGIYELEMAAKAPNMQVAPEIIRIAVGVNPPPGMQVLDAGHLDITANLATGRMELRDRDIFYDPANSVIAVPSQTLQQIPPDPAYRFLGRPGQEVYMLPQAVLGRHIHGEIDPHLWQNARNAIAYVDAITEALVNADPSRGAQYRERANNYVQQLRAVDAEMAAAVAAIPPENRNLVTTHHGYAYLEQGYGLKVGGFVSPNPAIEPSPRDIIALRRTLENLQVPAVFVEPNEEAGSTTLKNTATELGIQICRIYGDTLDTQVPSYIKFMQTNAAEFKRCLGRNA
ncbi:anchored repeat ABC transporter, substrate-binding protein [Corynebacterium caspium]|uniref:anchored repeat ABC transporter, substrate-binding protein n=1 Tax=Corynebacterium caspium TaxID=234828 RepID=UPI0012EA85B5|nr:anchored repeat ABC transporter, substrate-binding protein [Corynebacterium caspium]